MNTWPKQNYASMVAYYGNVGEHQTQLILPYPMRLAWDISRTVTKITCHEKVHDSLEKILNEIFNFYSSNLIAVRADRMDLFGGCLNVRKVRGGNSWSIHNWGTAIDLDPEHNTMSMHRNEASMRNEIINIFESEGWSSMGRSKNYDFMHFQAATF